MVILLSVIMIVISNNICKQQISGFQQFNFPDTGSNPSFPTLAWSTITIAPHILPLVEQELLTKPRFQLVRVTRSLVYVYVSQIVVCPFVLFSFGHCVFRPSSIYEFGLPLWYLQTLLQIITIYFTFTKYSSISWRTLTLVCISCKSLTRTTIVTWTGIAWIFPKYVIK